MSNPQKRWILSAILSAGLAGGAASAPGQPAAAKKPAPAKAKTVRVAMQPAASPAARSRGLVDIAARPRVTVRSTARAARPAPARRTTTRRTTTRPTTSRATSRLAQQPGMGRRGAFSSAPLRSKTALMNELRNNAGLRRNLSKHFGVPESRLIAYIDNNLEYSTLRKTTSSWVMGVSRTGKLFKVRQRIPAGTPVFCLSDRTPILKSICGNPIVFRLPPTPKPVAQTRPIQPPGVLTVEVRPEPVPGVPSVPGTLPVTAYLPPTGDVELPPTFEVAYAGEPVGTLDAIPGQVKRRGGGAFPWWIAGGAIPFFFLDDDDDDGGKLIPEPNSIALFAAGAVPLAAWLRRRSRKETSEEETSEPDGES